MKKLYYFSKSKLQFIEIKNYKTKLTLYFSMSVILFSSIIFGGYYFINNVTNSQRSLRSLKEENKELRYNLDKVMTQFQTLNNSLDSLSKINNDLRIAANLAPISKDENMLGIGGGSFDNSVDFLNNPSEGKLKQVLALVDAVSRKISFEKTQYVEISSKLKENKKLFAAIPAIRPCTGRVTDGFGMRMHPILHILRMHEGIDFEAEVGTPVYATGNGVISFVGHRGGYGLAVEINHGFGYVTVYAHLSKTEVKEGQRVKRGQEIAKTGDTGLSTGPHLHYEVRHNGIALNPNQFFFGDLGFFELTSKN
jgi:murein DD-endopeptidase MepM/ murein hydrolase activator NlpD